MTETKSVTFDLTPAQIERIKRDLGLTANDTTPAFKVGDKVRLSAPAFYRVGSIKFPYRVGAPKVGALGIVTGLPDVYGDYMVKVSGESTYLAPECLELAPVKPEPKFKAGDKVRVTGFGNWNGVGTVQEDNGVSFVRVSMGSGKLSGHTGSFSERELYRVSSAEFDGAVKAHKREQAIKGLPVGTYVKVPANVTTASGGPVYFGKTVVAKVYGHTGTGNNLRVKADGKLQVVDPLQVTITEKPGTAYVVHDVAGLEALPDGALIETQTRSCDGERALKRNGKFVWGSGTSPIGFDAECIAWAAPFTLVNPKVLDEKPVSEPKAEPKLSDFKVGDTVEVVTDDYSYSAYFNTHRKGSRHTVRRITYSFIDAGLYFLPSEVKKVAKPAAWAVGDRVVTRAFCSMERQSFGTIKEIRPDGNHRINLDEGITVSRKESALESLDERELIPLSMYSPVARGEKLVVLTRKGHPGSPVKVGETVTAERGSSGDVIWARTSDGRSIVQFPRRFARA